MDEFRVEITGEAEAISDIDKLMNPFPMDQGLGMELVDAAVSSILVQCAAQRDPDEGPWPPLDPRYAFEKSVTHPGMPIGRLDELMLSREQLLGTVTIQPDRVEHHYGNNIIAIKEAIDFTEGGAVTGTRQPPRPFFGFPYLAFTAMNAVAEKWFTRATT